MTAEALAWLCLLVDGRLVRGVGNDAAWTLARDAGWARPTPRRDELRLDEAHRDDVQARLDRLWPGWRAESDALGAAGLRPTPAGWQALQEARRRAQLPAVLPEALNRRTVAAAVRDHAKARVAEGTLGDTTVTHDNLLRIRPHPGLVLLQGGERLDGAAIAAVCGEVCVTDRAFRAGTILGGSPPRAVLLVENLGVYVDVPLPDDWCAVHVPGWNTRLVTRVRDEWPQTPALIFGDLDPNGAAIARSLRAHWPRLDWFVPSFAADYLDRGRPATWPEPVGDLPPVIRALMARGVWLEQELLVLDPRLTAELRAWG